MSGPAAPKKIVVVGSLNADFVVHVARYPRPGETVPGTRFQQFPGGKGANQAYGAARVADGAQVAMLGQVGNDAHASWLRQNLASVRVDVGAVGVDPAVSTGVAVITVDESGQNQIVIAPGANGTFTPDVLRRQERLLVEADYVLLQLEVPLETVTLAARIARGAGATVLLDPAPARPLPDTLLRDVDYLTPNESELLALDGGEGARRLSRDETVLAARRLCARGARNVVAKLGSEGVLLVGPEGEHFVPSFPVRAIDTTAAGDCWNAAFAVALADGRTVAEALRFASAAAAISVTRAGAQPSMPSRAEALALFTGRAG